MTKLDKIVTIFNRAIYEIESPHFLSILRPLFLLSSFEIMQILPIDSSHVASGKEGGTSASKILLCLIGDGMGGAVNYAI